MLWQVVLENISTKLGIERHQHFALVTEDVRLNARQRFNILCEDMTLRQVCFPFCFFSFLHFLFCSLPILKSKFLAQLGNWVTNLYVQAVFHCHANCNIGLNVMGKLSFGNCEASNHRGVYSMDWSCIWEFRKLQQGHRAMINGLALTVLKESKIPSYIHLMFVQQKVSFLWRKNKEREEKHQKMTGYIS